MLQMCKMLKYVDCGTKTYFKKMSLDLKNEDMSSLNHLIFTVKWIKNTHLVKERPSTPHLSIVIAPSYSKTF